MEDDKHSLFGSGLRRLEALTDGVFAIVMTLMVFNLALPKDKPITSLRRELLDLWPNFLAYAISFGIGRYLLVRESQYVSIHQTHEP